MLTLPGDVNVHAPGGMSELLVLLGAIAASYLLFRAFAGPGFAVGAGVGSSALGFLFVGHNAIPIAVLMVGLALAVESRLRSRPLSGRGFGREAGLVLLGLLAYEAARMMTEGAEGTALANARQVIDFERSIGLYFEDNLQGWLLEREAAMRAVNTVYSFVFLAATVWTLLWLFLRDRENYRLFRNALGISTVLAIITIALLPVAPPRLVAESGLVDSVVHFGREHHFANEYAAVPSLHVGWMALAGFVIGRSIGGWRGRIVGVVPGSVMGFTVIVTGNHYWIDGMIGAVYSVGPALVMLHWKGLAATGARTGRVILATPRLQLSLLAMGGLLTYLVVAQATAPGFTDFWWYLVIQMVAILVLLTAGEVIFREQGGISWQTHIIAATCSYLDVLGTDGNLYARIDEYDKLTHFMGVAAITSGAYDIFRGMYARGSRRWVAEDRLMAAVSIGVAVGVGWEVYEYLGDAVFHTTRIQGRWDTTNDIISDTLGAMVAGIWLWWGERSAEAEPAPGRSGPTGTA